MSECRVLTDPDCKCDLCELTRLTEKAGGYPELFEGAHNLMAPDGPRCTCTMPSVHESGWCGECKDADCRVNFLRSRACELGTRACTVQHHWQDCALNHGGTECDMGPECGDDD